MGPYETEKLLKAKNAINRTKQQHTEWKKIFINPISNRRLIPKVYKELKKIDIKMSNLKMGYKSKQNSQ